MKRSGRSLIGSIIQEFPRATEEIHKNFNQDSACTTVIQNGHLKKIEGLPLEPRGCHKYQLCSLFRQCNWA
jgi:hypothetical protein